MPLYDYQCSGCGEIDEKLAAVGQDGAGVHHRCPEWEAQRAAGVTPTWERVKGMPRPYVPPSGRYSFGR